VRGADQLKVGQVRRCMKVGKKPGRRSGGTIKAAAGPSAHSRGQIGDLRNRFLNLCIICCGKLLYSIQSRRTDPRPD
jgi:hypothetical protein